MCWFRRRKSRPYLKNWRIRTWFAWLPCTIGEDTRWLRYVTVEERYSASYYWTGDGYRGGWYWVRFVDDAPPAKDLPDAQV